MALALMFAATTHVPSDVGGRDGAGG